MYLENAWKVLEFDFGKGLGTLFISYVYTTTISQRQEKTAKIKIEHFWFVIKFRICVTVKLNLYIVCMVKGWEINHQKMYGHFYNKYYWLLMFFSYNYYKHAVSFLYSYTYIISSYFAKLTVGQTYINSTATRCTDVTLRQWLPAMLL